MKMGILVSEEVPLAINRFPAPPRDEMKGIFSE